MQRVIIGGVIVLVLIGGLVALSQSLSLEDSNTQKTNAVVQSETEDSQPSSVPEATSTQTSKTIAPSYTGEQLAGASAPYIAFNSSDYNRATQSDKIIVLDFYAHWCPECRQEAPIIKAGFDSLTTDKVVGFRVNFNDSDTDNDEKALAKTFKVPYQHTKVILKNGSEIARSSVVWDKKAFDSALNKALGE